MTENDPEQEDVRLRSFIQKCYPDTAIAQVEIQRDEAEIVTLTIHTPTPGAIIGARGQMVETVRAALEEKSGKKVQINVISTSVAHN
jgi:small subunit ribosomal protein S3